MAIWNHLHGDIKKIFTVPRTSYGAIMIWTRQIFDLYKRRSGFGIGIDKRLLDF